MTLKKVLRLWVCQRCQCLYCHQIHQFLNQCLNKLSQIMMVLNAQLWKWQNLGKVNKFPLFCCSIKCPYFQGWKNALRALIKFCCILIGNVVGACDPQVPTSHPEKHDPTIHTRLGRYKSWRRVLRRRGYTPWCYLRYTHFPLNMEIYNPDVLP